MKKIVVIVLSILFSGIIVSAEEINPNGLWAVSNNLSDGSVLRLDNLIIILENDTIFFNDLNSIVAKGLLKNDTIFLLSGFVGYGIEWIDIVSQDSLVSSLPLAEISNGLSFVRIDLTGNWNQIDYSWNGDSVINARNIVQDNDSVLFYASNMLLAKGLIRMDSLIVITGFEGIGIDYFTISSNDTFDKTAPLVESIDRVAYYRINSLAGINQQDKIGESINLFPNPCGSILYIQTKDRIINNIKIYSFDGRLLKAKTCVSNSLKIDLLGIPAGQYFLEIGSNGNKSVEKFIKINN